MPLIAVISARAARRMGVVCMGEMSGVQKQRMKKALSDNRKQDGCELCGYKRCFPALHFHHMAPHHKELSIYKARGDSHVSVREFELELDRCIVLCANCHTEVHYGITVLPTEVSVLFESCWEL
jgi:hypothetical protein